MVDINSAYKDKNVLRSLEETRKRPLFIIDSEYRCDSSQGKTEDMRE